MPQCAETPRAKLGAGPAEDSLGGSGGGFWGASEVLAAPLEHGQVVGTLEPAVVQMRVCGRCYGQDTDAWAVYDCRQCQLCRRFVSGGITACRACGASAQFCKVKHVTDNCRCQRTAGCPEGSAGVAAQKGSQDRPRIHRVAHIVEDPQGIANLADVECPTDYYYYDCFEKWLWKKFPKASPEIIEHMVSLCCFLDVSILSGFS